MAGSVAQVGGPRAIRVALLALVAIPIGGVSALDEPSPAEDAAAAAREQAIAVALGHLDADAPELAATILGALAERHPHDAEVQRLLGAALLAAGRPAESIRPLSRAARSPGDAAAAAAIDLARASARLGRPTEVVRWLDRAWEAGFRDLARLRADPDFVPLAGDERFERLILAFEASLVPFPDAIRVIHEFRGAAAGETYGWVAIDAGDVDADGVRDAAISAPGARRDGAVVGRVEVRSGRTGELLVEVWGTADERFGAALGALGDLDGDGRGDIIIGAPGGETSDADAGRIAIHSGRDGARLAERAGAAAGDRTGAEARGVGDWDGDGVPDLLVGSPGADSAKGADAGRLEILSGADLSTLHRFEGERAGDRLGGAAWGEARPEGHFLAIGAGKAGPDRLGSVSLYRGADPELLARVDADESGGALGESHVSLIGDVDADGVPDFALGDWRNGARGRNTGRLVVHSGADGARLRVLTGGNGEGLGTGDGVAGDANGDGHADIVVGAWLSSRGGSDGGAVFLYSGKDSTLLETWACRTIGEHIGFDATGIGDVDGDGAGDFLVSGASSWVSGRDTGRVFIVAGPKYYRRPGGAR